MSSINSSKSGIQAQASRKAKKKKMGKRVEHLAPWMKGAKKAEGDGKPPKAKSTKGHKPEPKSKEPKKK